MGGRQFGRLSPNIWGRGHNQQLPPISAISCITRYAGMNRMRQRPWTGRKSARFAAMMLGKSDRFCIWWLVGFAICNARIQTPIIRRWCGGCWHGSYSAHQSKSVHQSNCVLKRRIPTIWLMTPLLRCPMLPISLRRVRHRQLCDHAHEDAARVH